MRKFIYNVVLLLSINSMVQAESNPFFGKYNTPFETTPFDKIKTEHYEPAFQRGIDELKKDIDNITNNPKPATFENTIVALERSGKLLNRVSGAFFNVLSANANDEMMEISQRVSPSLTESSNYIYLNPLVTMVASVIILHEQITWITLMGAACIILGVYLAEKK